MVEPTAASPRIDLPEERTEALVRLLRSIQVPATEGADLSDAARQANATAFADLDDFFDFERLVHDPITPYRDLFSAEQLRRFERQFREVIRLVAFPSASRALNGAHVRLKTRGPEHGREGIAVTMTVRSVRDKREADITFHWIDGPHGLRVGDLRVEGASLVDNYRRQFGRMLKDGSVETLLEKLAARLEEARHERVVAH